MSSLRFASLTRENALPAWRGPLRSRLGRRAAVALLAVIVLGAPARGAFDQGDVPPKSQVSEYAARVPKTVIELQKFRQTQAIEIDTTGGKKGTVALINLNPTINVWYLLRLTWRQDAPAMAYHLENSNPHRQRLLLDESHPHGLVIAEGTRTYACDLWTTTSQHRLEAARRSRIPYAPLCDGKLYLRNPVKGHQTAKESVTDFLRDNIWGGVSNLLALYAAPSLRTPIWLGRSCGRALSLLQRACHNQRQTPHPSPP